MQGYVLYASYTAETFLHYRPSAFKLRSNEIYVLISFLSDIRYSSSSFNTKLIFW